MTSVLVLLGILIVLVVFADGNGTCDYDGFKH